MNIELYSISSLPRKTLQSLYADNKSRKQFQCN